MDESIRPFRRFVKTLKLMHMKKYLFYLSMALVAVVLFSCKSGKKSVFTPTSSGRAYEVLVVVEKPLWERPAGRALYNVLDTDVP